MEQCGVLPVYRLILELTGIVENHPRQDWASAFIDLLLNMKKVKDKTIEAEKECLSNYYYRKFDKRYGDLIKQTRERTPLPVITEKKHD